MKEIDVGNKVGVGENWKQEILPGYESEIIKNLNQQKREILSSFFTNPDGRVTAIKDAMPPILAATLTARFSRAQEFDVTELFWKEFVNNKDIAPILLGRNDKNSPDFLLTDKARKIVRRILDEYGDDSVREQASGYVMVKGASVLTSMNAFRHPLVTGIEASTRYINWTEIPEDQFSVTPEKIKKEPKYWHIYSSAMNNTYEIYKDLWAGVTDYVSKKNPNNDGLSDKAYMLAIKGAVCDALRGLLPLGIKTNFGIHANYRTFSELVMNLRSNDFLETRQIANEIAEELAKVSPEFISVTDTTHGQKWTEYQANASTIFKNLLVELKDPDRHDLSVLVELLNRNWIYDLIREAVISKSGGISDLEITRLSKKYIADGTFENMLRSFGEARKNRRDKLPDIFDSVGVRIKIDNLSFGAFKDLNRHRKLMSKSDPDFSGARGFIIPEIIEEAGGVIKDNYSSALARLLDAKIKLESNFPEEAKLLLPHGARTAFETVLGLGEAFWISELRSIASGNPEYRKIAIEIYNGLIDKAPVLTNLGSFVDSKDYSLGRIKEAVRADLKGK